MFKVLQVIFFRGKPALHITSMLKKIVAVNAGRPNFNTAAILRKALEGAESVGAKTEFIDLHKITYAGCVGCMGCKAANGRPKKCYHKDALTPVLEKVTQSDGFIVGCPIYFMQHTGTFTCFMERLLYPYFVYGKTYNKNPNPKTRCGIVCTMGINEQQERDFGVTPRLKMVETFFGKIYRSVDSLYVRDTRHVTDYSKFEFAGQDPEHKYAYHREHFPTDLANAFELGKKVARD